MYETLELPLGPDVHVLRADLDAFLVSRLRAYGVSYFDRAEVVDFRRGSEGVVLAVKGPDGELALRGSSSSTPQPRVVFRASLRAARRRTAAAHEHAQPLRPLQPVPSLEDRRRRPEPGVPLQAPRGTQHHCFDGGWIWVIPFDNGVTSVGVLLDPRLHPEDASLSAEDEMRRVFARFPTVQAHLSGMRPVRKIIRTGRVQFHLEDHHRRRVHSDAARRGLHRPAVQHRHHADHSRSSRGSCRSPAGPAARPASTWRPFAPSSAPLLREVRGPSSRIVSGTMRSWGHFDTFKQFWRVWGYATIVQYPHASSATTRAPTGAR